MESFEILNRAQILSCLNLPGLTVIVSVRMTEHDEIDAKITKTEARNIVERLAPDNVTPIAFYVKAKHTLFLGM